MQTLMFLALISSFVTAQGVKMASKDCEVPERQNYSAPGFSARENLSTENCGIWDRAASQSGPWRVEIKHFRRPSCHGTLISPTSVITWGCTMLSWELTRATNKSGFKAFVGDCFDEHRRNTCEQGGLGRISQLESGHQLSIRNYHKLHLFKIQRVNLVENKMWPICLFNKTNQHDFEPDQKYEVHPAWYNGKNRKVQLTDDLASCLKKEIQVEECPRLNSSFCLIDYTDYHFSDMLLHIDSNGRNYLRGVHDFWGKNNRTIFSELLPHFEEIAALAGDIQKIPAASTTPPGA